MMPEDPDGEQVGYRRPPTSTRFVKGRSGNPRGRPHGRNTALPYEALLGQMVTIHDDGRARRVNAAEAFILHLTQHGLEGHRAAARAMMEAIEQVRAIRGPTEAITTIILMPGSAGDGTQQVAASGASLRETGQQYQNVAGAIDGSVKFLNLIQQVANKAGQTGWFGDATYTDANGGVIDLAEARTTSLVGMIDTGRQLDALLTGTIVTHLGNGQTAYGVSNPGVFLSAGAGAAAGLASTLVPSDGSSDWSAGSKGQVVDRLV